MHRRLPARAHDAPIADLYPGEAKTDARDARVIADAARTMPHTLRDPAGLRAAGPGHVTELLRRQAPRMAERLAAEIFTALDEQTVVVPGTHAAAVVLPGLTSSLRSTLDQRKHLAAELEHLLEAHPLSAVLTSMPGIGIRTGARILAEIGDATAFPSAAHLAAYAGLAPVTRRSGSSIKGETPALRGNRPLKRALFLSAFASLSHPPSRAYYDRKISEGKRHNQALLCLARRRCDVLYAMIRNGTLYQQPATVTL